MHILLKWIISIFIIFILIYIIVWNIMQIVFSIKCHKMEICRKKNCWFHQFCQKYEEEFTEEDLKDVNKLLEELKAKQNHKNT